MYRLKLDHDEKRLPLGIKRDETHHPSHKSPFIYTDIWGIGTSNRKIYDKIWKKLIKSYERF
jgi:hypothetical protein